MTSSNMDGRKVLLVEDDFIIAMDVAASLEEDGASVIGPASTVPIALDLIGKTEDLDGAILDVNIRDSTSFEIADALQAQGVPFIFVTGYDTSVVPERYAGVSVCQKPFDMALCSSLLFK